MKLFPGPRGQVHAEVVFLENLWQVSQIAFGCAAGKILQHVAHGSGLAPMIENVFIVGKRKNQCPARLQHSLPLFERLHRVSEVLKVVAR